MERILARPNQNLQEHLSSVSQKASQFGEKIGLAETCRTIGFFHDLGKVSEEFQTYIRSKGAKRGSVSHSKEGAKLLFEKIDLQLSEVLLNPIMGHHGALYDNLTPQGEVEMYDTMDGASKVNAEQFCFDIQQEKIAAELNQFMTTKFDMVMTIKYIFSCLVDADRLDAYEFDVQEPYQETKAEWDSYLQRVQERLDKFKKQPETPISIIRQTISDDCARSGQRGKGTYKLEVATGGGKTLASLRFAIEHAKQHEMDRIIYVIPYLSIIDQTEEELKEILGEDVVLAHHSGVLFDEEDEKGVRYKLNIDRWDKPIVITTMVQFLETIFSSKASKLRKLHNMANSVIIFDEIQNLPVKTIHLFNGVANFLVKHMRSTLLLCSATQPAIDKVVESKAIKFTDSASLTSVEVPVRVRLIDKRKPDGYSPEELTDFALELFDSSMLMIFNTKRNAVEVFDTLKDKTSIPVFHLSTNMCSAHRKDTLDIIRKRLKANEPVFCVTTQLIEAGVDISFKNVIRAVAGLDSIKQAAGRCNRHGEYEGLQSVYIVNQQAENLKYLPEIKEGRDVTERLLNEGNLCIEKYYHYLFERFKQINDEMMDFPVSHLTSTIYDLLTENYVGRSNFIARDDYEPWLTHAIRTAGEEFFVIEKGRQDVIVPYGEARDLLEEYDSLGEFETKRKKHILRQLGQYSISLYSEQLQKLKNVISGYETGVLRLADSRYNKEKGLFEKANLKLLMYWADTK